jgi:hypothetical protein
VTSHTAPRGHTFGTVVPMSGEMNPIGVGRQLACPVRGWNVPTGQSVKLLAAPLPPVQNAPRGHLITSPSGQYDPAGHGVKWNNVRCDV